MQGRNVFGVMVLAFSTGSLSVSYAEVAQAMGDGRPSFLIGEVRHAYFDGIIDDLLTAGLGADGLGDPVPPPVMDAGAATELRRLAIYNNYRALVDTTPGGGYGTLYGPTVGASSVITAQGGRIAGHEYLAYARSGRGGKVTLMVQVPDHFNPDSPCIVTAPSSGSRGIYGAIGTAGEWGLKQGCVVAYTDKGTGTGAHNLQDNTVQGIDGVLADAGAAGRDALFAARMSDSQRARFNADTPDRFAFKHAHSQQNPEQDWGWNVLQSIELAFHILNTHHAQGWAAGNGPRRLTPDNTVVIASSVSNGGGASVRAAELDRRGLIDGVVVSEPNVTPAHDPGFSIVQGNGPALRKHSRSLYDYTTLLSLYQGCANVAQPDAPFNLAPVPDACTSLANKGLLQPGSAHQQALEAQRIINDYGIPPEQNVLQPLHWWLNVPQSIAVTYANAYGRFSVRDNLCGFSMGATDAGQGHAPVPLPQAAGERLFGTSNGIPPTGGVNLIYNNAAQGPVNYTAGLSPSSGLADHSLDGFLCLRSLATGEDPVTDGALRGRERARAVRVGLGIDRILADGDLGGRPALVLHGRSDAILSPNHTSRAYFGLNRRMEGSGSGLRYYEVLNAHHLDTLNALAGLDARFIPLHFYFAQAMDLMYAHLTEGTQLPASQVVRTTPRGRNYDGTVPAIGPGNLPAIHPHPPSADRIVFESDQVRIPE
ncbi:MAG: 3-hydroxybutyrate oligomer hydrolase family protein [Aquisalimonadaceae bacterium]